ncbi:MAG: acetyl-CoA carboxylase carboxyltransferase subunit alpha [Myxococcales bacterium]|nr:acetyl-CoA carboxylase carboxyltransferase subunit alpha [Myxococcales bacterium]
MAHLDFEKPLVELEQRIRALKAASGGRGAEIDQSVRQLEAQVDRLSRELFDELTVWQKVQLSRHPDRPYFLEYAEALFEDLLELHGDRCFGDDPAVVAGFARFDGRTVAVIGHQKGRSTKEKVHRNFGMARPEGYRKAVRVMDLAERFGRPVLTFIDTPGAYPGVGAEERGQSEAIGRAIARMARLRVPVIATVIGEGGSGGALGLGVANRVLMLEYGTYSVITPEGCASILWRDGAEAPRAAEQLRILASDALELGVIDEIIAEPVGGAHRDPKGAAERLGRALRRHLDALSEVEPAALREERYAKVRAMGRFASV